MSLSIDKTVIKHVLMFVLNFLVIQIPLYDPNGAEIPTWKREMMAKKAAEKAKKEAIERRAQEEEYKKLSSIPAWKRQLIENRKVEDPSK